MTTFIRLFAICLLLLIPARGYAAPNWDSGVSLYNAEKYAEAAQFFKKRLSTSPHKGQIYYNLGNCYFKLNKLGEAMFYYQKATQYLGSDPELAQNIQLLRQKLTDKIDANQPLIHAFWNLLAKQSTLFYLSLFLGFSLAALATFYQFLNRNAPSLNLQLCIITSIISGLFLCGLTAKLVVTKGTQRGVIIAKKAHIKSGPDQSLSTLFILHEGTVFTVTKTISNWRKIKLANGLSGWINQTDYWQL